MGISIFRDQFGKITEIFVGAIPDSSVSVRLFDVYYYALAALLSLLTESLAAVPSVDGEPKPFGAVFAGLELQDCTVTLNVWLYLIECSFPAYRYGFILYDALVHLLFRPIALHKYSRFIGPFTCGNRLSV